MPPSLILDNAHINTLCTKVQFAANACPAGSVMGTAKAVSPLLDKPLEGTVYLVTGYGHKLPDVLADLKGQVDVDLDGDRQRPRTRAAHQLRDGARRPGHRSSSSNLPAARRGCCQTSANNLCARPEGDREDDGPEQPARQLAAGDPPVVRQALRPRQPKASGLVEGDGEMTGSRTKLGRRIHLAILGACLATAMSLFAAGPAEAIQYVPHTLEKSIDGSETPSGSFNFGVISLGVDQQSGSLYVLTNGPVIKLFKFTAQGAPSAFTDPSLGGSSEITVAEGESFFGNASVEVDNSGGPYQGRIYVKNRYEPEGIWAFEPSGAEVGGNFPLAEAGNGMAVSPANGNFFVSGVPLESRAYEYSPMV